MRSGFIVFILLMAFFMALFWGCGEERREPVSEQGARGELPSQEGWDSKLYLSNAGRLQAIVKYGHMRKYQNRHVYYFDEGVEVDFYNRDGDHTSHLTCETGEYDTETEDVAGAGNVVVVSDSGMTLHTERLYWDQGGNLITSDTLVMLMTLNQDTLYGVGFQSKPDLSHWIIKKPWGIGERRVKIEKIDAHFSSADDSTTAGDASGADSTGSVPDTSRTVPEGMRKSEEPPGQDG